MIGNLYCNEQSVKTKYYEEKLQRAIERLAEFNNLRQVFKNFDDYHKQFQNNKFSKNVIFNLLSSNRYEETSFDENSIIVNSPQKDLQTMELAFEEFFIKNKSYDSRDFKDFLNKLTSKENFTSLQAYHELKIGHELKEKLNDVSLFHKTSLGKKPDLYAKSGNKNIVIELTGLNSRKSEQTIEKVIERVAQAYLSKYSIGKLIIFLFDTFDLPTDENGHIDENKSVEIIEKNFDKIELGSLKDFNGAINFRNRLIELYETNDEGGKNIIIGNQMISFSDLLDVTNDNELRLYGDDESINILRKWLEKVNGINLDNILFDRIIFLDNNQNHNCVMLNSIEGVEYYTDVQTTKFFKPSGIFYKMLVNHIQNRTKFKVCEGQYEDGLPFIIAIRAPDWHFDYEKNYEDFIPIHNQIEQYLKEFDQVSGVWLYTNKLYDGLYIENPCAQEEIRLTENELINAGILRPNIHRPFITYDKKVDFANLDFKEKTSTLNKILDLEPRFDPKRDDFEHHYARADLLELFENMGLYLKEKEIDDRILIRIEIVIAKYIEYIEDHESDFKESYLMYEEKIMLGTEPIRSVATSALVLLIRHLPKDVHIKKIITLSKDKNSYVQASIAKNLDSIYEVNPKMALELASEFINDNLLVRWFIRRFIKYILYKNKTAFVDISSRIIYRYQELGLSKKERILVDYIISLITQSAILDIEETITKLFDTLINSKNKDTLSKIIFTMRNEMFLANPIYTKRVLQYYCTILEKASPEIVAVVDFALFYHLVNLNKSLYPEIVPIIETIVNTEFPKTINYNRDFKFMILDYIEKFYSEIGPRSEGFLLSLIAKNLFLLNSAWSCKIVDILDRIIESQKIINKSQFENILGEIECIRSDKVEQLKLKFRKL